MAVNSFFSSGCGRAGRGPGERDCDQSGSDSNTALYWRQHKLG